jgi:hypothetical protein
MLADAGMGILSIRVVYWHYSVLQRKLSNKKMGSSLVFALFYNGWQGCPSFSIQF